MGSNQWLPHLTNEIVKDARGNLFCSYLIALEGWRRGLTPSFTSDKVTKKKLHSPGLLFKLSSDTETHTFYKTRGDMIKGEAFSIGSNKFETKKRLKKIIFL